MQDGIITSEASSKSLGLNSNSRIVCRVCEKQFSQYTCPRCNIRYCSLPCYKSHSARCTESFMKENVMGELQQMQSNEESKSKMLDILKRFHEEDETDSLDDDETDSTLSEETIQKILSGGQISFDDLSVEEKKHFHRAIASGELSKLIEPWEPWWLKPSAKHISLSPDGTQLIQPITKHDHTDHLHDTPPGPESPLPPVAKLTTATPSPLLPVHLIDIIYSYCFTLRLYNGDPKTDPFESASVFLSVSSVFGQSGQPGQPDQPETVLEALLFCLEKTCSPMYKHMGGLELGLRVMDDVISLLYLGGPALVCLLCDLLGMIRSGGREVKGEKVSKLKKVELKSKLKYAERKIYFVMCWVHEQPFEAWSELAGVVEREKCCAVECSEGKRGITRTEEKRERGGKPLIKEVE